VSDFDLVLWGRAWLRQPARLGPGRGTRAGLGQRRAGSRSDLAWVLGSGCRGLADGLRLARRGGPPPPGFPVPRRDPCPAGCLRAVVPAQMDCVGEKQRGMPAGCCARAPVWAAGARQRLGGGGRGWARGGRGRASTRTRLASAVHTGEHHAHRNRKETTGKPGKQANRWSQSQPLGHRRVLVIIVRGCSQLPCLACQRA